MNINDAILELYPNLTLGVDFMTEGQKLVNWLNANPQPTQADLDAQSLPAAKTLKRRALLIAFKTDYAAVWLIDGVEVEEQKDAILAKTAANRTANETALVNQAGALITKIKTKFADVKNATTEAQVQAITWT